MPGLASAGLGAGGGAGGGEEAAQVAVVEELEDLLLGYYRSEGKRSVRVRRKGVGLTRRWVAELMRRTRLGRWAPPAVEVVGDILVIVWVGRAVLAVACGCGVRLPSASFSSPSSCSSEASSVLSPSTSHWTSCPSLVRNVPSSASK